MDDGHTSPTSRRAPRCSVRRHKGVANEMPATQSDRRTGRRHRRIGITMLVAGVIVLVAAFTPTSANAQTPNSLVPTGPATFDLSCTGTDDTTNTILTGVGLNPLVLPGTTITTNAVADPGDG